MSDRALSADPNRHVRPLWRNVSFVLMWSSVAASGFGDRIISLAALTLMGGNSPNSDTTSLNAGLSFWFFLPYLVLGAPAGWLADCLPRKWIMLACDESRAALLLLAFLLVPATGSAAAIDASHHWKVWGVIAAVGAFAAIFNPSRNATIPQIVPLGQLQKGNALILGIAVIASLIGVGVGGVMFDSKHAGSVRTGLIVGFLFYAVSGTFFAFLRIGGRTRAPADQAATRRPSAVSYVRSHRSVMRLILVNMLVWGVAMVVYNAAMGLCKRQYGFDPEVVIQRYTVMAMLIGLGMLCGAGFVAWMNSRRESGWVSMAALLAAGICAIALALTHSYPVGLVLAFGVGLFGNTTMICVTTLLQAITPNYIRGRVMGFNALTTTITTVASNLVIWRTPDADTFIVSALKAVAVLLAVVALWGLWLQTSRGPLETRLLNVCWHVTRAYVLVWHRLRWINRHHVPSAGPVIIASNHTTSLDPFLIQMAVHRTVRWLMDESYRLAPLKFFWRAVDPIMMNRSARETGALRELIGRARDGQIIGIFSEGAMQRDGRELKPFHPCIGLAARRSGAFIVPVWISGTPRKHNILWHFLRPSRSTVVFGQAYKPDRSMADEQIVADLRRRMVALSNGDA